MSTPRNAHWSRRDILKYSGVFSTVAAMAPLSASAVAMADSSTTLPETTGSPTENLYTRIGVRPLGARISVGEVPLF